MMAILLYVMIYSGGGPSTSTLPGSKWRSQKGEYTQLPVSSTACASGPGQKGGDRFPVLDTLKFLAVLQVSNEAVTPCCTPLQR
jgi:hypothetical protein